MMIMRNESFLNKRNDTADIAQRKQYEQYTNYVVKTKKFSPSLEQNLET